jgi:hypothetical protein
MNIYKLYAANGDRAGFWVQHRTWKNMCAHIQSIADQQCGALPGPSPLHDNAKIVARIFDVRSGRPIPVGPSLDNPDDHNYTVIAEPAWSHSRRS